MVFLIYLFNFLFGRNNNLNSHFQISVIVPKGLDSSNNIDSRINLTTFFNLPDICFDGASVHLSQPQLAGETHKPDSLLVSS